MGVVIPIPVSSEILVYDERDASTPYCVRVEALFCRTIAADSPNSPSIRVENVRALPFPTTACVKNGEVRTRTSFNFRLKIVGDAVSALVSNQVPSLILLFPILSIRPLAHLLQKSGYAFAASARIHVKYMHVSSVRIYVPTNSAIAVIAVTCTRHPPVDR
ncbi:hypothetical protein EVAR_19047_1 [Eumeta japonica]|uniref:Uncharacterized protein n=1 Tax=Eumeta variegata TaxID=151549 RepID=A0A4C1V848_EUMVA|nr:hypothetical protein EVAR_19047_1 [Eumeta japonica]